MRNVREKPVILSLLDTDKYKFSMQQIFLHKCPTANARYRFKCRTKGVDLTAMIPAIREQVAMVADMRFQDSELRYLSGEPHLSEDFIDFLSDFRLNAKHVHIQHDSTGLDIVVDGPIAKASPWEIYLLAIVNELYYRITVPEPDLVEGRHRLMAKIKYLQHQEGIDGFQFTDFGTRRRFSREHHYDVVRTLKLAIPNHFIGTSNYYLAREFDLKPIGTMAHEYLQAWQGLVHPLDASKTALNTWADEFRGCLGDALTDVIGVDAFCADLDLFIAKQFDGFRHDSGDPFVWCEKIIARLKELNINPKTKRAIWSDSLTFERAVELYKAFSDRMIPGFGIGTNLTNDLGYQPLNIVMKLVELNGRPVAKLSDSPGKTMCENENYVRWLAESYGRLEEFE